MNLLDEMVVKMKKRDLFSGKIQIDEFFSMQVDKDNQKILNIYNNNILLDKFLLNKRIFTLFKVLQTYIQNEDVIIDKKHHASLYGKEIFIEEDLFMQLKEHDENLYVEFYKYENDKRKILYRISTNHMSQRLFSIMLLPKKAQEYPKLFINPNDVKEIIDILSVIKI